MDAAKPSARTAIYWPDIDEEAALAGMLGISESALKEAAGFETHDLGPLAESAPESHG